jgi:hypothetical protein
LKHIIPFSSPIIDALIDESIDELEQVDSGHIFSGAESSFEVVDALLFSFEAG